MRKDDNLFDDFDDDFDDEFDDEKKAFWEQEEKKDNFFLRLWRKKAFKIILFALEVFAAACLIFGIWLECGENAKMKFLKSVTGCAFGQSLAACIIGDDYDKYLLDKDFKEEDINVNVELEGDYTNIALFGVDSRNGDNASLNNNSDTIMILSINNETKEVKIASVYRDTMVEFDTDYGTDFAKATDVYAYGGPTASINMLNKNFDLDIKDYVTINWSGLVNVIDAFGGVDVTITDDEAYWLNDYLLDLEDWTGANIEFVSGAGPVHLNGAQAVSYCRIRYVTFYGEDGTEVNNDFGRTARQRLVISKLVEKAKQMGVSELISMMKDLIKQNTEDNTFMKSSLTLKEMINLVPMMIEVEFDGGQGFPSEYISYTLPNGGSSLACNTLLSTAKEMHAYLFVGNVYTPSTVLKNLSAKMESYIGTSHYSGDGETEETTTTEAVATTTTTTVPQEDPKKDDPSQDDPSQDDPSKDDPSKDDPSKDDPSKDDPSKDDPSKDDPSQDDPSKDDPSKDDPSKDDPSQSDSGSGTNP